MERIVQDCLSEGYVTSRSSGGPSLPATSAGRVFKCIMSEKLTEWGQRLKV